MESKGTIYWIIGGIVLLGALFWFVQQHPVPAPSPTPPAEPSVQKELYLRSLAYGRNASAYRYAYSENLDGFIVNTTLINDGENRQAILQLPFMDENVFQAQNVTLFCIQARGEQRCTEVQNNSEIQNFLVAVNRLYFKPLVIDQTVAHQEQLIDRGVITFVGAPIERTINGKACTQINFHYDITRLTLADLSTMNIPAGSLGTYDGQWCIGTDGAAYEKVFSYVTGTTSHQTAFKLQEANWEYTDRLTLPNHTNNASTLGLFSTYTGYQQELQSCYSLEEVPQERCISSFALNRNFASVCGLAGSRSDQCYISLALADRDETLCPFVQNPDTRDNCYVEVAGRTQRSDLCSHIQNASKNAFCMNVSTTPAQPTNGNGSNMSGLDEGLTNLIGG